MSTYPCCLIIQRTVSKLAELKKLMIYPKKKKNTTKFFLFSSISILLVFVIFFTSSLCRNCLTKTVGTVDSRHRQTNNNFHLSLFLLLKTAYKLPKPFFFVRRKKKEDKPPRKDINERQNKPKRKSKKKKKTW